MKKYFLLFLLILSGFLAISQNVLLKPNPRRLVNDAAGVLSAEQAAILEQKLVALDDSN